MCLYTRGFRTSVWPHRIFWQHFADFPKLLKNNFVNKLDLTSFKFTAIKCFFLKFRRISKATTENNKWTNWWIQKVLREIIIFVIFSETWLKFEVNMQSAALIPPDNVSVSKG